MRLLANSVRPFLGTLLAQQPPPKVALDPGEFEIGATQGTGAAKQGPRPKAGPAPHLTDGRPDFGGSGAWYPGFSGKGHR
jgi:hypothetical protein